MSLIRRVGWIVLAVSLSAVAVAVIAVPRVVPPIVERWAVEKLSEFGVDAKVSLDLDYCWRNGPGVEGVLSASIPNAPWRARARFGASCCEWSASVTVPATPFSESDALARALLAKFPPKGITNLAFSGSVALDAKAERTFRKPVPVWKVGAQVRDLKASMVSDGQAIAVDGLSAKPEASGIADHVDIAPMFLRAKSAAVGAFALTNFHATVRATEKSLIVNEAGAGFCGGKANVYSLYLDPANLNTGFTLFLEDVDAGEVLSRVNGFRGEASGRLHGKVRAFVREGGKAIRLREAFLYSTPGETGKLRMANPEAVAENLAYAGLDGAARANVSDALTDLDYKVLRLDLKRLEGSASRLSVQIGGTATRGQTTVPVDLTINLNGELEQLLNAGLGYSAKLKGKKK